MDKKQGKTLEEFKNKWESEKEYYRNHEVGTGVQSFIKEILKSKELFNLKEGAGIKKRHLRKNEFIHEKTTKQLRQADFVVYINSEVIIPIEAETYGSIKKGESQLRKYQIDYERKYGILTDGYSWRFYNNNLYREFTIYEIIDDNKLFLEYWKEYIKPKYYYLSYFEEIGQLSLLKGKKELKVEKYRKSFFEDITVLIRSLKRKLQVEGYFKGLDKNEKSKKATEITYAYVIQFILYKTLVDNDFAGFKKEFKQNVDKIHKNIKRERYKDTLGLIEGISAQISKDIYRPFSKEQKYISKKVLELYRLENTLKDVSPWLDIFVFIKKYNFQNIESEIFGYVYENYLKELFEEGKKGQYFTDPDIVRFMLKEVGYTSENVGKLIKNNKRDKLSLIDPSCGSGTFLYSSTNNIINSYKAENEQVSREVEDIITNNIFGLDIEEFPLYLAEMNILMRMLPLIVGKKYNNPVDKKIKVFLTKDSVAEFVGTGIDNTKVDEKIRGGQLQLGLPEQEPEVVSFMRDAKDVQEMKSSLRKYDGVPRRRYDYVVGNPPYISYNECSKQGVLIFDLMRKNKAKLSKIYGVNLHSVPGNPKKYRPNPNLYAFFTALGLALLKDEGKLCYIVPQTFLINPDYDVLRYHLSKYVTIQKMISFSGHMFIGRGLKQNKPVYTSSLIFVLSKKPPLNDHSVEIVHYKNADDDIQKCLKNINEGKKITKKQVQQKMLLENISNWNFFIKSNKFVKFYKVYKKNNQSLSQYYDHKESSLKYNSVFIFDGGYDIDERKALEVKESNDDYEVLDFPDEGYLLDENNGYWPNHRQENQKFYIKLRQANQGYKLLDSKYKVIWPYLRNIRFIFTDRKVIWSRRTTNTYYGIGSANKEELLYLLGILNSSITKAIISCFKLEGETKRGIMVSSSLIKNEIKVPTITQYNEHIKKEIINKTQELINLEGKPLFEFVDFSKTMVQKFDKITVKGKKVKLFHNNKITELDIKKNYKFVKKVIENKFPTNNVLINEEKITLSRLKNLRVIDKEAQSKIKEYIDNLVFSLYFNIPLKVLGLKYAENIENICSKNSYYSVVKNIR